MKAEPARASISPYLKAFLAAQLVLLVGTGVTLTFLADRTDEYFAWTIRAPITAAFLGVGYWAGTLGVLLALRRRRWVEIRAVVVTALAFTSWNIAPTLWYLDQFHFDADGTIPRLDAWAWLLFYLVDPPLFLAAILHHELRERRRDEDRTEPLLPWVRAAVTAFGAALVAVGLAVWPLGVEELWPWVLPPLSAGAVAGWPVAIGVGLLWCGARERDWLRVRIVFAMYGLFAALQLVTALRHRSSLEVDTVQTFVYLGVLVASLAALAVVWQKQDARATS